MQLNSRDVLDCTNPLNWCKRTEWVIILRA